MQSIIDILSQFEAVSLEQIEAVKLMNRIDSKYLLRIDTLPELLAELKNKYLILNVNGQNISRYHTRYYDTKEFSLYHQHQTGRLPRTKIRKRTYLETAESFLELKQKNNHRKTFKNRILLIESSKDEENKNLKKLIKISSINSEDLQQVLNVYYSRITLVNKAFTERLTIDTKLSFSNDFTHTNYAGLCIIELKQNRLEQSPVRLLLKQKRIFPTSLSKYCLGIASLYEKAQKNNIKEKIRFINKLCHEKI